MTFKLFWKFNLFKRVHYTFFVTREWAFLREVWMRMFFRFFIFLFFVIRESCIYLRVICKPTTFDFCSCPTELISSYLDSDILPIVKTLPTYIRHQSWLRKFSTNSVFNPIPSFYLLWTLSRFILLFLMTRVFVLSNIFLIAALF